MMHRRKAIALATSGLAVLGTARSVQAQGALEKLRVAGPPTEDATNLFYAVKTGIPQRNGLDIEMIGTASGTAATTAVIGGTYEIARTSLLPVITAHLRGIPVVIVGPDNIYTTRNPFSLLQVAPDATFRTAADLNGKTIGTPALNDFNMLATRTWVDKNGGDWKSLKFVEIPNSALEAAITQKRVDAAILQTAQLDASLAAGTTKTFADALAAISPQFLSGVYIARREWAAQHTEALRRFNRVLNEGSAYVNTHAAETVPLVVELTKIEVTTATKMHRTINGTSVEAAQLQAIIDAAAKYDQIPRAFSAREIIYP
jgi:NitT/TauT family transport system substrate-binding protein